MLVSSCIFYRNKIRPLVFIKKGGIITVKEYIKTLKDYFILFY